MDENTEKYCLYKLYEYLQFRVEIIRIPSGEKHKTIQTCQLVWSALTYHKADRHSLLINLGGGVIGDLGGFCAATFMRGISFIHMPTTLLSMVDSSIGGKLGVDFMGYKNMVGLIKNPSSVIVLPEFLDTLPLDQLKSGYAELLKHGLIADKDTWEVLIQKKDIVSVDFTPIIYESILIKKEVTEQDPNEKGLRKILNFGHTIGHAVESYWLDSKSPLLHGEAIAIGMISEAYLSYRLDQLSESELFSIRDGLINIYGHHPKFLKPSEKIIALMQSDKKNYGGDIRFSLLKSLGQAIYDISVPHEMIEESFIFYTQKI